MASVEAEPNLICRISVVASFFGCFDPDATVFFLSPVCGTYWYFMKDAMLEIWMFAILGPSVASHLTSERGMLNLLALHNY